MEKENSFLDNLLNTGLGIARDRLLPATPSPRTAVGPAATTNTTDWKKIGLIGGAAVAAIVVIVLLFRR